MVGGGAAGLMAAITAKREAREHVHISIYEQNREPAKKILASGNGRCNISNTSPSGDDYFGRHPHFVTPALTHLDYPAFERFARTIGLTLDIKSDGRVYPLSNEARSVKEAMVREARRLGVAIHTDARVESIEKKETGFSLHVLNEPILFDRVLLATGSPAAPQLGGNFDGMRLARSLGHTIVEPYPALVGLHLAGSSHTRMSGIKVQARLRLYVDGRVHLDTKGDLLFTRYGISGFAVLDLSTEASRWLAKGKKVTVGIHLLPDYDRQGIFALLQKMSKAAPWLTLGETLQGVLPHKIVTQLLMDLDFAPTVSVASVEGKSWRKIAATLSDWRFDVTDTHGYKHAEVAGGGVDTAEVSAKTMASKKVEGLFFAGEVLDIVGKRGGFNLHFAWASGQLAGRHLIRR